MDEFAFRPTHVAAPDGMATWAAPDPSQPSTPLDPLLPVRLIDRRGDWAYVLCSNGWSTWVDGRLLVALPDTPPAPGAPPARTADPRRALAEVEAALNRYRSLLEDLAAGQVDLETFRERARGLRIGLVVDGEALWVFDAAHDRWCYCDGLQLQTYAASGRPRSNPSSAGGPASPRPPVAPATPRPPGAGPAAPPGGYEPTRTGEP
ncbi:hypothetical protein RMN57_34460 [Kitasatospora sp. CM 4170]|uniref:Uncharacterized protein n=1 Tax=Kitasatospora aburaviensis TaxID=67265 RepID=A0ABW1F273_9ACTN|nr:hypothetical protein [Kitasatospora sp. CM 4170]WNM49435.1 hypothetical protein RMN57_34460 [Kitasatospora sp. CM 4170]